LYGTFLLAGVRATDMLGAPCHPKTHINGGSGAAEPCSARQHLQQQVGALRLQSGHNLGGQASDFTFLWRESVVLQAVHHGCTKRGRMHTLEVERGGTSGGLACDAGRQNGMHKGVFDGITHK
jgi:hypothetical protein